jgi:Ig domain of plant-specific actin-binding protein
MVKGMFRCRRRPGLVSLAALAALLVILPAAASADSPPVFSSGPVIQGDAVVGSTLQVVATWTGDPAPTATYRWGRCPATNTTCTVIGGATATTYTVTGADVGYRLAVEVTLTNEKKLVKATPPTAVVTAAAASEPPAPNPVPTPAVSPPPAASPPVTISTTATSLATPAPTFLRPFPVVRIRGFFASRGARITLLSVRGPHRAQVNVRCRGRSCPVPTLTLPNADTRVHRFERFLRAGTLLQIRVTRPGRIGTYTSFLIRSRKAPLRKDRCLSPRGVAPIACSAP